MPLPVGSGRQLISFSSRSRACGHSPTDEIEAMIAAQAMAAHHASMECSRRAMVPDQPCEAAQGLRKAAANASRTFVELLSALDCMGGDLVESGRWDRPPPFGPEEDDGVN